jgi:hypothetical protein
LLIKLAFPLTPKRVRLANPVPHLATAERGAGRGTAEREVMDVLACVFTLTHLLTGRAVRAQLFALSFEFSPRHF